MSKFLRFAALGAAITAPIGAYALIVRPWTRRWGVQAGDAERALPGDDLVPEPTVVETRAITIDAAPQDIWPWLVQMGYGRGGWYGYDQVDMIGHSATGIMPEWQHLAVGDTVPTHPEGGFEARVVDPDRALVLYLDAAITERWKQAAEAAEGQAEEPAEHATAGIRVSGAFLENTVPREFAGSWAFVIEPTSDGRTRLIERLRFHFADGGTVGGPVAMEALGFGVFLMVRRQMLGIRDRAERLARTKLPAPMPVGFQPLPTAM